MEIPQKMVLNLVSLSVLMYIAITHYLHFVTKILCGAILLYNIFVLLQSIISWRRERRLMEPRHIYNKKGILKSSNLFNFEEILRNEYRNKREQGNTNGLNYFGGGRMYSNPIYEEMRDSLHSYPTVGKKSLGNFQENYISTIREKLLNTKQRLQATVLTEKEISILAPLQIKTNTERQLFIKPGKLNAVLELIVDHSEANLDSSYEQIEEAYQSLNRSLLKCFGITVSSAPQHPQQISFRELRNLLQVISRQRAVPKKYSVNSSVTLPDLLEEINFIRKKLEEVPDLQKPSQMFRMSLLLYWLKQEFPEESFVLIEQGERDLQLGKTHEFVCVQSGIFWYAGRPELKTKSCEAVALCFLLGIFKKYERSTRPIIQELAGYLRKNR